MPEGSSYWLGLGRACIFSGFLIMNLRNTYLAGKGDQQAVARMVLPMLMKLIYAYIALNIIVAIVGIATIDIGCEDRFKGIFLAIQMGAFHTLLEGLAFYLMRYGTGWKAIRDSLLSGLLWGIITFIVYFVQLNLFCGTYNLVGISSLPGSTKRKMWLGVACGYNVILMVFYGTFIVLPSRCLYRRPALKLYAQFQFIYQIFWIIGGFLVFFHYDSAQVICALSAFAIILMVFVHPAITYYTLRLDSQYWQGLVPEEGNPLADVWGSVGVATATSMARNISDLEVHRTVKLLHFGLLELDSKLGFIPGGFSRVYFGTLRGRDPVAVKVIFSIELSPHEIVHFCREAKILGDLPHPNIVQCLGVCVMPPALALVFEFCKYGSLFNFLYVAVIESEEEPQGNSGLHRQTTISPLAGKAHRGIIDYGDQSGSHASMRSRSADMPIRLSSGINAHSFGAHAHSFGAHSHSQLEPALPTSNSKLLHLSDVIPQTNFQRKGGDEIPAATSGNGGAHDSAAAGGASSNTQERETLFSLLGKLTNAAMSNASLDSSGAGSYGHGDDRVTRPPSVSVLSGLHTASQIVASGLGFTPGAVSSSTPSHAKSGLSDSHGSSTLQSRLLDQSDSIDRSTDSRNKKDGSFRRIVDTSHSAASSHSSQSSDQSQSSDIEMQASFSMQSVPDSLFSSYGRDKYCMSLAVGLTFEERISLMLDAASSMAFLHSKGFLHCDVKSLNFLVCEIRDEEMPPPPSVGSSPRTPRSPGGKSPLSSPHSSPNIAFGTPPSGSPVADQCQDRFYGDRRRPGRYMLKLADMGEARTAEEISHMAAPPQPSRNWAPPEVLTVGASSSAYTASSDVFGLALVLSEVPPTLLATLNASPLTHSLLSSL